MRIKHNGQRGFSAVEGLLVLVAVGILGFTGWYVLNAKRNADHSLQNAVSTSDSNKLVGLDETPSEPSRQLDSGEIETELNQLEEVTETINFVDTSSWVERASRNASYTVKLSGGVTYGSCEGIDSSILIGMVFMNESNVYDCGSLKNAVTWQHPSSDSMLLLTRIAIGPSEDLWDRGGAKAEEVTLAGGQPAKRYKYSNNIDGATYYTIEYSTTHNGKDYTAVMHWDIGYDVYSSELSPDVFDTIVQKTWQFN